MSGAASDWLDLYEQLSADVRELNASAREHAALGGYTAKDRRMAQVKLDNVNEDLERLGQSLEGMQGEVGAGELGRRRNLVTKLRAQAAKLGEELAGGRRGGGRGGKRKPKYQDTAETEGLSNKDLLQQQQSMEETHDEQLDSILAGVGRLKAMGQDINTELDLHEGLLEELDDSVDNTDARLQSSILRVDDIKDEEASCMPLMCIFLLLAVIVGLLFV